MSLEGDMVYGFVLFAVVVDHVGAFLAQVSFHGRIPGQLFADGMAS